MKKGRIAIIALALVCLVSITGCGSKANKKVICTTKVSGVDVTFNIAFEGKKIKTMDFNYNMDLSSYSDTQVSAIEEQDFCSVVKKAFTGYKDAFTNCKQSIKDKHLLVESDLDVNKLSSDAKDTMVSPEKAKEGLESSGFTCEIK